MDFLTSSSGFATSAAGPAPIHAGTPRKRTKSSWMFYLYGSSLLLAGFLWSSPTFCAGEECVTPEPKGSAHLTPPESPWSLHGVANELTSHGISAPADMAGLTAEEVMEVFDTFANPPPLDLINELLFRARANLSRPKRSVPIEILLPIWETPPSKRARTQFPSSSSTSTRDLDPNVPAEAEALAIAEAHKLITDLIRYSFSSSFIDQWKAGGERWAHFMATNWGRLNVGSIKRLRATLTRFITWNSSLAFSDLARWQVGTPISSLTIAEFLETTKARGKTVPSATWHDLKWFTENASVSADCMHSMLQQFRSLPAHYVGTPAEVLPLQLWKHLRDMATSSKPADRTHLQWYAGFVLRYIISSLRLAHAKRAKRLQDKSNNILEVWHIWKGKTDGGIPFEIPLPSHVSPNCPLILELAEFSRGMRMENVFLPVAICPKDEPHKLAIVARKSTHAQFHRSFRALAELPPLSLGPDKSSQIVSYSSRRFMDSLADAMLLSETDKNYLGNWKDRVGGKKQEPTHVRYSSERLFRSAGARRLLLAGLAHGLKHKPEAQAISELAGLSRSTERLRDTCSSSAEWGMKGVHIPPPEAEPFPPPLPRQVSEASSASEGSLDDGSSDEADLTVDTLPWITPFNKGKIHFLADSDNPVGLCGTKATDEWTVDQGITKAVSLNRQFCVNCMLALPSKFSAAILKAKS